MESVYLKKILLHYKKKKWSFCLVLLKKLYYKNSFLAPVYILFFLVYQKLKKYKKAYYWLKIGYYQLPKNKKIAQLFAYYTLIFKKENIDEALVPLSFLAKKKAKDSFTDFILSRYYYKKGDLERSFLYIKSALKKQTKIIYKKWYLFLLYKYSSFSRLKKHSGHFLARKLCGELNITDSNNVKTLYEKISLLKSTGVILLESFTLNSPLYQYWVYKKYHFFLPNTSLEVLVQVLKENGFDVTKLKSLKNTRQTLNKWIYKIIGGVLVIALLYLLLKGIF